MRAADAIQDTILTCWEKLTTLKDNRLFKTWMTRILIHKCYDVRKYYKKMAPMEEEGEPAAVDDTNHAFMELLSVLEEKYRIPMLLFYGQGYRTGEIAEILHIPKSTVQTRLARGREKLTAYYKS